MRVYRATECDWVLAESPAQARECAIEHMGNDDLVYPVDEITVVSNEDMQRLKVSNEDDGKTYTFQQELDWHVKVGTDKPVIFASSEY